MMSEMDLQLLANDSGFGLLDMVSNFQPYLGSQGTNVLLILFF
jgi:hypothetical protein